MNSFPNFEFVNLEEVFSTATQPTLLKM